MAFLFFNGLFGLSPALLARPGPDQKLNSFVWCVKKTRY